MERDATEDHAPPSASPPEVVVVGPDRPGQASRLEVLGGQFVIAGGETSNQIIERSPAAVMAWLTEPVEPTLDLLAELAHRRPEIFRLVIGPADDAELIQRAVNDGRCDCYLTTAGGSAELATTLTRGIAMARRRSGVDRGAGEAERDRDLADLEASLAACQAQLAEAHRNLRASRHEVLQLELQASITQLVRGLAHELNNPLSAILGHAQRLRLHADRPDDIRRRSDTLIGEAERCIALVERLRSLGAPLQEDAMACSVGTVVGMACERLEQRRTTIPPIAYRRTLPMVMAPQRALARCLEQILDNAIQAGASHIWIDGEERSERLVLHIDNDGAAVGDEEIRHAVRPFFTTRSREGHHGLGLSLASSLLREMGGSITLDHREEPGGARCTLVLPVAAPADYERTPTRAVPSLSDATEVLVVDDEPMVAELLVDLIEDLGHHATTCGTREAALEKLRSGSPRALLLDVKLPDGDGLDLASHALRRWPRLVGHCALITGDPHDEDLRGRCAELGLPLIAKPFQLADIQRHLAELV